MYWFFKFILPFIGALAVRLRPRRWQTWIGWIIACSLAFFVTLLTTHLTIGEILLLLLIVSALGFLGPEIWQGIRQSVTTFFSRPKNWLYLAGIALVIYGIFHPEILGTILILVAVLFAIQVILRGFLRPKR